MPCPMPCKPRQFTVRLSKCLRAAVLLARAVKLGDVSGELYFGVAENDIYVSEEETAALKAHLPTIDVQHTVETYPGTEHGFVFPERYCFSPEGAELHYERLADLFDRNLS